LLNEIITGIAVGVGLALITVLAKKFTQVIILQRDLSTMWRKYEVLEKKITQLDGQIDSLKTKIAVLEATRKV